MKKIDEENTQFLFMSSLSIPIIEDIKLAPIQKRLLLKEPIEKHNIYLVNKRRKEESKIPKILPAPVSKSSLITNLPIKSNKTCQFYYNPVGNPVSINRKKGDKIYIIGNMTDDEPLELSVMIHKSYVVYAANILVEADHEYHFHFVSNNYKTPFVDCHYPIISGK